MLKAIIWRTSVYHGTWRLSVLQPPCRTSAQASFIAWLTPTIDILRHDHASSYYMPGCSGDLFLPFQSNLRLMMSMVTGLFSAFGVRNPWFWCFCASAAIGVRWLDARCFSCFWASLVRRYSLIGCGPVGTIYPYVLVTFLGPFYPACFPRVTHTASIMTVASPTASCLFPPGYCCRWNFGCAFPYDADVTFHHHISSKFSDQHLTVCGTTALYEGMLSAPQI